MAVYKETSFWGKWERKKELEPGKKVVLWADYNGLYDGSAGAERIEVEDDRTVKHVLFVGGHMNSDFLGGERINEAELETQGPLSLLGIRSKVVFGG